MLCEVDLATVQAAGYDPTTVLVITNTAQVADVAPAASGTVAAGAEAVVVTV